MPMAILTSEKASSSIIHRMFWELRRKSSIKAALRRRIRNGQADLATRPCFPPTAAHELIGSRMMKLPANLLNQADFSAARNGSSVDKRIAARFSGQEQ